MAGVIHLQWCGYSLVSTKEHTNADSETELGEMYDAGLAFYAADFWAIWDLGIIATGLSFFVCRMIGLSTSNHVVLDTAFDILSVEALFLVRQVS